MNSKKCLEAMHTTRGKTFTIQEALNHAERWVAYWMLYNTPESKDSSFPYEKWIGYVDYVRSKPE